MEFRTMTTIKYKTIQNIWKTLEEDKTKSIEIVAYFVDHLNSVNIQEIVFTIINMHLLMADFVIWMIKIVTRMSIIKTQEAPVLAERRSSVKYIMERSRNGTWPL